MPKGPSLDPADKRLAVQVEDHPLAYGEFEGIIPRGQYGGGTVMLWDRGRWAGAGDTSADFGNGKLKFELSGEKLRGGWTLVRMGGKAKSDGKNWLLIKENDEYARTGGGDLDVLEEQPASVVSGRSMDEIAAAEDRVWKNGQAVKSGKKKTGSDRTPKKSELNKTNAPSSTHADVRAAELANARKRDMPREVKPQLATLVKDAPKGDGWLHEIKFDGYRLLCAINNGKARLITRNGHDWTRKFPRIAAAAGEIPLNDAWLDGELVAMKANGVSDFQSLQNALKQGSDAELAYYVFDLPFCDGYDLTRTPLIERKRLVRQLLSTSEAGPLRYSDHLQGEGGRMYSHACSHTLEGIISKRADSAYQSRRARTWVKIKCMRSQEFVVCGYSDPAGSRKFFGALLLGYHDPDGRLVYCGRVGTGFDSKSLKDVHELLSARTRKTSPARELPEDFDKRGVHWVRPDLVVETTFANWTDDGLLRQASFQGVREDKKPRDVVREQPAAMPASAGANPSAAASRQTARSQSKTTTATRSNSQQTRVAGQHLTHPDRVLYPGQDVTKQDLALFYERIADWVLPHITKRPLSLVRCPQGSGKSCFFQKHITDALPDALGGVTVQEKEKRATYITISDLSGLIALVQLGVLEIHPWGSRADNPEKPDRLVFDLDPAPELGWQEVIEGALMLRERLNELRLKSFVKTSGGKGLHVVVPVTRRTSWEDFKAFSKGVAQDAARREPQRYIATMSKAKRKGKIFIDWLRNGRGATSVAAYSTRARAQAPVSTPVSWDELDDIEGPAAFTLANVAGRLESLKADPWQDFFEMRQSITIDMLKAVRAA